MEIFSNAVLLSALTVTGAFILETVTGAGESTSSTTTGNDGATTSSSTGTPTSFAISRAASDLSGVAADIVEESVNTKPRITIAQGTSIKVFVNSDLIFPRSVSESVRFIQ
jgi:type IV secretion system protein VirB10